MTNTVDSLVAASARIGADPHLVQAGGGNTSLKENGTLWIKASGMWLAHAATEDMFVPVPLKDIDAKLRSGDEKFPEFRTRSGRSLRPSVETAMHAALPQRVVIHVHSVATIAWAAQNGVKKELSNRLQGLRWAWIPYIHPGIPLALRIREEAGLNPEVLILGNHGLVVAAEDISAAEALLADVERRLQMETRPAPLPDLDYLEKISAGTSWTPAPDKTLHTLATDLRSCQFVSQGTMYPDHCVYLGPAAAVKREGESLNEAIARYSDENHYAPAFLLVEGVGLLVSKDLTRAGGELLGCLKRVAERIPAGADVSYLEDSQVARLMNWDAEKYRISVARQRESRPHSIR
jgi:rhamnose utilization protein RhaD (predicted bifunctional aldolase and dehydrogenase)